MSEQTTQTLRQCPECGCDRWAMRDAIRQSQRVTRLERDVRKLAGENGVLIYQARVKDDEHSDHMSRSLRKINRQARVIKRLEERLRALNAKPYEDAPLGESAPAVEYDAEHPDA